MSPLTAAAAGLALFAAGYAARCIQPLHRLDSWAWRQVDRRTSDLRNGQDRRRPGWYVAQAVFAAQIGVAFMVWPRRTWDAWQHRNDPPPPSSPAVKVGRPTIPDRQVNEEQEASE